MHRNLGEPADVRSLLGMNTPVAAGLLLFYCAGITAPAVVFVQVTDTHAWQAVVTILVYWSCGIALLTIRRDPLPLGATVALTGAAPVMTALVTLTPPLISFEHSIWPSNVFMVFLTFLCVRGRTWFALISMGTTVLVICVWTSLTGQGALYGIMLSLPNFGPLAMSTMFAVTIRPAVAGIFAAHAERDSALRKLAAAADARKALDQRLLDLAQVARPLIERIGDGRPPSPELVRACETLDSQISAALRRSGLVHELIDAAADAARNRGVTVLLEDHGGLGQLDAHVHQRLVRGIADELDQVHKGKVVISALPPGRPKLATVRATNGCVVRLISFDLYGNPDKPIVDTVT